MYIYNSRSFLTGTRSNRYIHNNLWKKQTKFHVQTICCIIQVHSGVLQHGPLTHFDVKFQYILDC